MANFVSWLLWGSCAAVSSLASADLLLSDRQKTWMNDRAINFWNWLDDQTALKYLPYLHSFRWQRLIVVLYAGLLFIVVVLMVAMYAGVFDDPHIQAMPRNVLCLCLGVYTGSFLTALFAVRTVLPRLLNWVTKTAGSWAYIGRSTVVAVAAIAAYYASDTVDSLWTDRWMGRVDPTNVQESFTTVILSLHPITAFVFGAYISVVRTIAFIVLTSWALVVIPVILILLLMSLFRVVQFVALRVAENPKAPQYALSVLLAAVGAAVNRFT